MTTHLTDRTVAGVRLIEAHTGHGVCATAYYAGGWVVDSDHLPNPITAVDYAHAIYLLGTLTRLHGSTVAAVVA